MRKSVTVTHSETYELKFNREYDRVEVYNVATSSGESFPDGCFAYFWEPARGLLDSGCDNANHIRASLGKELFKKLALECVAVYVVAKTG